MKQHIKKKTELRINGKFYAYVDEVEFYTEAIEVGQPMKEGDWTGPVINVIKNTEDTRKDAKRIKDEELNRTEYDAFFQKMLKDKSKHTPIGNS